MDSFGSRLRHERERRQIALKSIAESTKISVTLLDGLERDDFSRWPSGIFRKSFIRSYAVAVGLDPEPIIREFVERYPDPLEADIATPSAGARLLQTSHVATPQAASSPSSTGPLAIKLTITWSGSVQNTVARLADWKIVRMLRDRKISVDRFRSIFQSSNLPMVNRASPHGPAAEAADQVPPA